MKSKEHLEKHGIDAWGTLQAVTTSRSTILLLNPCPTNQTPPSLLWLSFCCGWNGAASLDAMFATCMIFVQLSMVLAGWDMRDPQPSLVLPAVALEMHFKQQCVNWIWTTSSGVNVITFVHCQLTEAAAVRRSEPAFYGSMMTVHRIC